MMLKKLELHGFKSFAKKTELAFDTPVAAVVGPNGSGKSNIVEAIRFVLGEQSNKSLRSSSGKDLIFAGSKQIPKMNRASVSITFDNTSRVFQLTNTKNEQVNVDFDEVVLTRTVFADGSNTYNINGHEVRMKDILELIASVNIGSSGHHIISQGEADRLLNANAKERKNMIEDALGLKLFQYRIKESEKKLEKTTDNLRETQGLRRELAPHLRFLKRQVEKIERAKEMRRELGRLYQDYFKREETLLLQEEKAYTEKKSELMYRRNGLDADMNRLKQELDIHGKTAEEEELDLLERQLRTVQGGKGDLSRQLGKLEGMIEIAQEVVVKPEATTDDVLVALGDVAMLVKDIDITIERITGSDDIQHVRQELRVVQASLHAFITEHKEQKDVPIAEPQHNPQEKIQELTETQEKVRLELQAISQNEKELQQQIDDLRMRIARDKQGLQEREREFFALTTKRSELNSELNLLEMKYQSVERLRGDFEEELVEGKVLVGEEVLQYKNIILEENSVLNRTDQESMRRQVERLKIKLEEVGGGTGADVVKEYEETLERDEFLEKEITDLETSMYTLRGVIAELQIQLEKEFVKGIDSINEQFQEFFVLMFGGGKAALRVVDVMKRKRKLDDSDEMVEEEEDEGESQEKGIEIRVNLPRKKITRLEMLSGGERSLTSIALLFALSQVNPPPFLVLDETDAALDEANSRRYGDMIENLSKYSQLMVVTHNRETMSRAGILYGITIGSEHCSQLLSVKFEEAQQFAK
jgi:chromosome segregation ATPase